MRLLPEHDLALLRKDVGCELAGLLIAGPAVVLVSVVIWLCERSGLL